MHSLILWKSILEIGFIWVLIYFMIRFLQGTRAVQVLSGLVLLVIVFNVAKILELSTINWVLTKLFAVGVLAFLIKQPALFKRRLDPSLAVGDKFLPLSTVGIKRLGIGLKLELRLSQK